MTIWPFNLMDEPEVTGFDREERRFWARTEGCEYLTHVLRQ